MKQTIINVRLEGPTEQDVRAAAQQMGLQISAVKNRGDTCHLYGSKIIVTQTQTVTVKVVRPLLG
jgi:hypothetical protein